MNDDDVIGRLNIAVIRQATHLDALGHCSARGAFTVTYVAPRTGAVRSGPALPSTAGLNPGVATYTGSGALILEPAATDCDADPPVFRVDANGVCVVDPGQATC